MKTTEPDLPKISATFAETEYVAIERAWADSESLEEFNIRMLKLWKAAREREARED